MSLRGKYGVRPPSRTGRIFLHFYIFFQKILAIVLHSVYILHKMLYSSEVTDAGENRLPPENTGFLSSTFSSLLHTKNLLSNATHTAKTVPS
jgi:hypothetical protein